MMATTTNKKRSKKKKRKDDISMNMHYSRRRRYLSVPAGSTVPNVNDGTARYSLAGRKVNTASSSSSVTRYASIVPRTMHCHEWYFFIRFGDDDVDKYNWCHLFCRSHHQSSSPRTPTSSNRTSDVRIRSIWSAMSKRTPTGTGTGTKMGPKLVWKIIWLRRRFLALYRFLSYDRRLSDAFLAYLNQRTLRFILTVMRRYPFDFLDYMKPVYLVLDEMLKTTTIIVIIFSVVRQCHLPYDE